LTFTYVLSSEVDSEWYTGSTGDLRARLRLHAEGRVRLKSGNGKRFLRNRLAEYLTGLRDHKLERHEV
jgi:predicted GIY-YIG superfamily endonuclease